MSLLNKFCAEFGLQEQDLGLVARSGRRCFLITPELQPLFEQHRRTLFGAGVYLGEERRVFEASPAILEIIASRAKLHKAVVNAKAEWLFLCDRDVFTDAVLRSDEPSASGFLLVQNERDENLGLGRASTRGKIGIKHVVDRGFFLRRERYE